MVCSQAEASGLHKGLLKGEKSSKHSWQVFLHNPKPVENWYIYLFQLHIQNNDMPVLGNAGSNDIGDGVNGPDGGLGPAQHRSDPVVGRAVEES